MHDKTFILLSKFAIHKEIFVFFKSKICPNLSNNVKKNHCLMNYYRIKPNIIIHFCLYNKPVLLSIFFDFIQYYYILNCEDFVKFEMLMDYFLSLK